MTGAVTSFAKKRPPAKSTTLDARAEGLLRAAAVLKTKDDFKREISALCDDVAEKFLTIGRYLIQAKRVLSHGEYKAMVASELPFGYQTAYQLKTVAERVDSGRMPAAKLPRSYATAFRLAALADAELSEAEARDLVRPDVTRREIDEFVREIRQTAADLEHRLTQEYRRLARQRDSIEARMREIAAQLGRQPVLSNRHDDEGVVIEGTATNLATE
jgi:hypothetical protein